MVDGGSWLCSAPEFSVRFMTFGVVPRHCTSVTLASMKVIFISL